MVKGGFIAYGAMGDSAASLMTCEPVQMRPQWGAFGEASNDCSAVFCHPSAIEDDLAGTLRVNKKLLPATGTRKLRKQHMVHNDACPDIRVDPQTFDVFVNGERAWCEPADKLPLGQLYMFR